MEIFRKPEKNGKKRDPVWAYVVSVSAIVVILFFFYYSYYYHMARDFCDGLMGCIDRSTDSICAQYDLAGGRAGQERRARRDEPCTTLPALTGTGDGRVLATGSAVLDPDP